MLSKTDNASLVEILNLTNLVSDSCLRVDVTSVKESMIKEEIQIEWIMDCEQTTAFLTKAGASFGIRREILL